MKKLIRKYLPAAVIFAAMYLLLPAFMHSDAVKVVAYQLVFPAAALVAGFIFAWKHGMDFTFPLIAPIMCILNRLIYNHIFRWHVYTFIYLIIGMLGCFIGDMVYKNLQEKKERAAREKRNANDSYQISITNISVENDEE